MCTVEPNDELQEQNILYAFSKKHTGSGNGLDPTRNRHSHQTKF